ncbi:4'-phosphopantetheinyl transferase family protein [Streptomyces sp. NBC_01689]|uniref:4'-phosphopantetheinyl transferase family protein n=2 Tax=unclassified Streptomyces TaxID=2593676 RepID=UPI002E372B0F|nr:4'-phosphopantetheinyl transferase superfamily protein [Streptomyces sp. NBC_01689]
MSAPGGPGPAPGRPGPPRLPELPRLPAGFGPPDEDGPGLPGPRGRRMEVPDGAGAVAGSGGVLLGPPLHVAGPEGPWEEVHDQLTDRGQVLVHTTWGQWLAAALLDPGLRGLLGRDWPRYRQTAAPAGRLRFAASRMVLKHTAAAALQLPADALDLAYRPGGRPHLRGLAGTEVSLAHTDELIVVAVSRSGPIGVDAEPLTRRPSFDLLHPYVCTPAEAAELAALPEDERTVRLLHLWTLKEAYTKALGHGMRRRFAAFGFSRDAQGRTVLAGEPATPEPVDDPGPARPGPARPGPDGPGPEGAASEGAASEGAGPAGTARWILATHLVHDRYLVSAAHRPSHPVETASRPAPHPLEGTRLPPAATLGWRLPGSSGAQPT